LSNTECDAEFGCGGTDRESTVGLRWGVIVAESAEVVVVSALLPPMTKNEGKSPASAEDLRPSIA
jgi:hypothetical protein